MNQSLLEDLVAPYEGVLTRLWRLRPGDVCDICPMRVECADRTRCLHLVASAGVSARLDGPYRRFPIGARQVGRVLLESRAFVGHAPLGELGLADPAWLAMHDIRSFAALPLLRGSLAIGVLAVFSSRRLQESDVRGLSAVASLLALEPEPGAGAPRPLREVEREAIERALVQTRGQVSGPGGAARILGLKPTTLQSRMKKLGVRRTPRRPAP